MNGFIWGIFTFVVSFCVMFAFLFVSTGFAPDECLISTSSGDCGGIAGIFPYPIRLIIFLAMVGYSIYLGIDYGKQHNKEESIKRNAQQSLENYRKKHNITPIRK